jgi:hypothetical protein
MAIILECSAETSPAPAPPARRRPLAFGALALALALLAAASGAPAQQIGNQGSGTLELPPATRNQLEIQPKAPAVPMQGQNVLVIPRASRDFVGEWGGYLRLTRRVGDDAPASGDSIVSLAFGESNGDVFMQTTAFAGRSSHIVSTNAEVVNPRSIKLKLKGLEMAFNPPLIHKEELHLALTGKNTLNCLKYVDFYEPGNSVPIASLDYEGDLHLLNDEERRELEAQVLEKGQIPQKQIESSRRFGP